MQYIISDIEPFEISRGFHARLIHTETMTIAFIDVDAGAELPEHTHAHEQVTNLLEGEFEFMLGGEKILLRPGKSVVIPSNVPHSGRALTKCRIFDVFSPVREDFRSGNVAYARR
jgi:quercetin dioxygenase-like cupin family protein